VIALVSKGKEAQVRSLGADDVILRGSDLEAAVQALDLEKPVDVVADVVDGPAVTELLAVLRPEGRYVVSGAINGPIVSLDLWTIYLKHLEFIGSSLPTHGEFRGLLRLICNGHVKPLLAASYPLERLPEAQRRFVSKDLVGKIVVTVATQ
jgi:NADPH:quinone reductase-like Zn-dependent oxidoreductase